MSKIFYCAGHLFKQLLSPSILLGIATVLALVASNSALAPAYYTLLNQPLFIQGVGETISGLHLMNDGLMVLFFAQVTLEIKHEFLAGRLRNRQYAILPLFAAIGGVIMPAMLYTLLVSYDATLLKGWAVPTATDIAFSLAILTALGRRIPIELKLLLSGLAIIDDLCAVGIIAFFYTANLQWFWLRRALLLVLLLGEFNRRRIEGLAVYLIIGFGLWLSLLKSGIHPTIAGVLLACTIPAYPSAGHSPLKRLAHYLMPWVDYIILPGFAVMNAGVPIMNITWQIGAHPLFAGIILGLCLGKPLGIGLSTYLAIRLGIAQLPPALKWTHIMGMACLGGIGFTMSLFITALAFTDPLLLQLARQAILIASIISAGLGVVMLMNTKIYSAGDEIGSSHKQAPDAA